MKTIQIIIKKIDIALDVILSVIRKILIKTNMSKKLAMHEKIVFKIFASCSMLFAWPCGLSIRW